ncbi:MAG: MraY family glycosyltransferase [Gallionella sp.]|nr:MraY family glycosyltransferase [Gallionella sp.]
MDLIFFLRHLGFAWAILCVSALGTWLLIRHLKAFDVPNERSSHTKVTPRGGGIAIVAAFLVGISMIHYIGDKSPISTTYFVGFLGASFLIAALSFYDDFKQLSFKIKLVAHVLAILVMMLSGIVMYIPALPFLGEIHLGWWAYPLTFIWVLGLTNSYNFIDGIDGIAASSAVIAALFFSYITYHQGSLFIYLTSLVLAAATLGFLVFNWSPAKIFMGDVGSTFLGFTFAVIAIIAARYDHSHTSFFVMPLLLFHFIFDTAYTFTRRLLAGDHVFTAHRTHLYQLLNRTGYTHKQVTLIYSGMAMAQGFSAIWMIDNLGESRLLMYLLFLIAYSAFAIYVMRRTKAHGITL